MAKDTSIRTGNPAKDFRQKQQIEVDSQSLRVIPSMDTQEVAVWLDNALESLINLRNFPSPVYGWVTLTDKWAEYDRAYEIRPKEDRKEHEYKGFSNIVLGDFHGYIETLKTREVNSIFGGSEMFDTKPTKESTEEDASLGKSLVKYNFDTVTTLRKEVTKVLHDRDLYGTWIAYTPYEEEEEQVKTMIDYQLDNDGNPLIINNVIQKEPEPYEAYLIKEKKYTDLKHLDLKKVYVNPRIENIQEQEAIFILMNKSYNELVQMEYDGILAPGMAQYVKDFEPEFNQDSDLEHAMDAQAPDDEGVIQEQAIRAYEIYLTYFFWGEGDDRKRYEAIFIKGGLVVGLRECARQDQYPLRSGCYIYIPGSFYGVGPGDEQYSCYIAKCARFNQVFDASTLEVRGGGFKDSVRLPNFKGMVPGEYADIPNLTSMLQNGGKPVLTWQELRGSRPSVTGLDVIPLLNHSMQFGTGATNLVAGMPTDSNVDDTYRGMATAVNQGLERINQYLGQFEEDCMVSYAQLVYENYQEHLDPEIDLPAMFDEEDLFYTDEAGKETPVAFPDVLVDINIFFVAVKRLVDQEKYIGKLMRGMQITAQIAEYMPMNQKIELAKEIDYKFLIKSVWQKLDVEDLDKIFKPRNYLNEVAELNQENAAMGRQLNIFQAGLQKLMQKLYQDKDKSAINSVNEVMEDIESESRGTKKVA